MYTKALIYQHLSIWYGRINVFSLIISFIIILKPVNTDCNTHSFGWLKQQSAFKRNIICTMDLFL